MLVSIIIPYYKSEKYIDKTINSVLNQTYKKWEIIIIDDENSEKSRKILSSYKSKKINILKNSKNLGVANSRNKGIKKSKGTYVAFLDSDDYWHKDKLKSQIKFMKKNNHKFSYTSYSAFKDDNIIYNVYVKKILNYKSLLKSNPICCSSVVCNKKILQKNKFPPLKTKEDYALWLRLSKKMNLIPLKKILVFYRLREQSLSSKHFNKIFNAYRIFKKNVSRNPVIIIYFVIRLYINAFKKKYI